MITRRQFAKIAGSAALVAAAQPASAAATSKTAKKGCCFVTGQNQKWRQNIERLKPTWMYSWGSRYPEGLPAGIEFTPMLWGDSPNPAKREQKMGDLVRRFNAGEVRHVLGFNEPDQPEQSDMTIERVLELWPELMSIGAPLVSPGCVHPDRDWMRGFMEEVERKRLRVDAVAVHSYTGPSVNHFVKRLEQVHQEFGRPIWITEFAVGDWEAKKPEDNRHSPERVEAFMREALPALEELEFVERYAWFSASTSSAALGTSALLNAEGDLTTLGEIYANH